MNYKKFYFKNYKRLHNIADISGSNIVILEINDSYEVMIVNNYILSGEQEYSPNHTFEGKIITTLVDQKYINENISIERIRPDLDNIKDVRIKLDNKDGYVFIQRN